MGLTSGAIAVSAGSVACAIASGGAVQCWGSNSLGQLGNGTTTDSLVPVQVTGLTSGATSVSVGGAVACAVVAGGAQCWGNNEYGQLGNGSTTDNVAVSAVQVTGLSSGVTAVSVSALSACALTTGGAVQCWGENPYGQLGNGTTTSSTVPVPVTGLTSGVTDLATAGESACALKSDGSVWCWGTNGSGQLGNGTTTNSSVPVQVL
jgi:alpha-tubulin suppressor-like RCC1 family protein